MIDVSSGRRSKAALRMDLLKCFGADFQLGIKSPLNFAGESGSSIIYPVGHHVAIRDIFVKEDLRKNDIMFIYNDEDVQSLTSMNITKDYTLLLICETKEATAAISIFNLSKLNFRSIMIFKAKRKIISSVYKQFLYASFSLDGNNIVSIGKLRENEELHGVIWDVQIFQSFKPDNYKPKCVFPLPKGANKITIENKIICTSGENHLAFWYFLDNSVKEFKSSVKNLNISITNFVDHEWINAKMLTLATITEQRELFILEGFSENKNFNMKIMRNEADDEEDSNWSLHIEKFIIKQHLTNIFDDIDIIPNIIKCLNNGIVVGSTKGHLLFIEKVISDNTVTYVPVRPTKNEKQFAITGLAVTKDQEFLAVSYESNEIAFFSLKNIFDSLKTLNFELRMNLVCDGFHQGPITTMDVAIQRPVIVTSSSVDKSVRVWNFLTGHCEYCKIIASEKERNHDKEMDILAVAIHPNGYYVAVSDKEMIRFYHLCYKELRYYNNSVAQNEISHSECHLLKFSFGGHLLAAVSGRQLYIIRSYSRETLKTFNTPHTSKIESVFFQEQDHYAYTVGSDGVIIEYNLFDFHFEKISSKIITYFSGCYSYLSKTQSVLIAVGQEGADTHVVNEILCTEIENTNNLLNTNPKENFDADGAYLNYNTNIQTKSNENYSTKIKESLASICSIKSKRFDIGSYATGSDDGHLSLYPSLLFLDSKGKPNLKPAVPWKSIKSHRGRITNIAFNRDTNLLFSSGDDGNLFIYCIHELQDGENLSYDNDNSVNINQITSILDEGLGDIVLYPLKSIFLKEDETNNQKNMIDEYKNQEEKLRAEHATKLREKEIELNKIRDKETRELNEKLTEERIEKENIIEQKKEEINNLENQQRQVLIDKEKQYTERIDQMSNTIHDLNSRIYSLKSEHEIELKRKDEMYEKNFKEIDHELRSQYEEIKNDNEKLTNDLKLRQKMEEYKFIHLDQEHEQEISYKNEKFQSVINKLEKERLATLSDISSLANDKKKLDNELSSCASELKKKNEEIKRHIETIKSLRMANEMKEFEKEDIKKKLKEIESMLQEKSKLAGFSSKLKNELYIKNVEIMSKFNKQQNENVELRKISRITEKQLDNNIKLLNDKKNEVTKKEDQLEEYKKKYESERHNVKLLEKELDNLLQKIYDTFQTNDKNIILKNITKIYKSYLTNEQIRKIDSSKLSENIRDELTKQIDFLQKGILTIADQKAKREISQNSEIFKKTKENAELIQKLNKKKKEYTVLEKDFFITKSNYSALTKRYEQLEREYNNLVKNNGGMIGANKLPAINGEQSKSGSLSASINNFASSVYKMKNEMNSQKSENAIPMMNKTSMGFALGKSVDKTKKKKGEKIQKGRAISQRKERIFSIREIKESLDEANEEIRKYKIEISVLQNNIAVRENELLNRQKEILETE